MLDFYAWTPFEMRDMRRFIHEALKEGRIDRDQAARDFARLDALDASGRVRRWRPAPEEGHDR